MARKIKKQPIYYTYLIGWTEHNIWYYGSKYSKNADPELFWKKYWTSSEHVTEFRKLQGEPDVIQIRRTFDCPKKTVVWEGKVHKRMGCRLSPRWLNAANANEKWSTAGMVAVKDKSNSISLVSVDDPRYVSGELIASNKGRMTVKDKDGNTMQVSVDDPRYVSGELISLTKGKTVVKDIDGNTLQVSVDDPRFLSGELVSIAKGKITVKDPEGNVCQVMKDDPRVLSGYLVSVKKGMVSVRGSDGKIFQVPVTDPRYISGELPHANKRIKT